MVSSCNNTSLSYDNHDNDKVTENTPSRITIRCDNFGDDLQDNIETEYCDGEERDLYLQYIRDTKEKGKEKKNLEIQLN